ncbi:MAG TPA: ferric reductase-like transmembrane domain-containing protein, partial [Acidimicrobiia bacterium]|nr:ferric reductase-like transmembrane domain-containing protein [Acidimicrobiia bacterium]
MVGYAIAVGAVVTMGLWLRHGGIGAISGRGSLPTAIGQVTALIGTYAMLVQILLMSRIAWLERGIGLDRLAVWHRWLGFATVWLITGHVVFTTIGYARGDRVSLWAQSRDFISHYPDVLIAWIGFLLLVLVAVVSMRAARRRMRRETWYFIHLGAYLAVVLSFAHQLAVGSDLDGDRAARVWWVGLYVLVFGAILLWRVLVPAVANARHGLRVRSVHQEAPGVVSITLTGRRVMALGAEPGQFFLWRFLTRDGWWKAHPFSLSAAPRKNSLRITVKDLGDDTRRMQSIRPGTRVIVEGPYGTFTAARRASRRILLVAGGIGITPLRALLDAFAPPDDVVLLYRIAKPEDAVFGSELRMFADLPNVRIH